VDDPDLKECQLALQVCDLLLGLLEAGGLLLLPVLPLFLQPVIRQSFNQGVGCGSVFDESLALDPNFEYRFGSEWTCTVPTK